MSTPSETAPAGQDALPTEQKTAAVVYNPVKVDLETLQRTVAEHEQEAGWAETLWFETSEEDRAAACKPRASSRRSRRSSQRAGDDATVRAVPSVHVRAPRRRARPAAERHRQPARPEHPAPIDDLGASVRTIFRGEDRPIDFGELEVERARR